jgi:uncharacterized protein YchJ
MSRAATGPRCPCGLDATYDACCGRWHGGPLHLRAPDAESLMRSHVARAADHLFAHLPLISGDMTALRGA